MVEGACGGDGDAAMNAVVDFPVKPEAQPYLARFARDPSEPDWLAASRRRAIARFAELGFPSRKSENWRYCDLQPLVEAPLLPQPRRSPNLDWAREHLTGLLLPGKGPRLVIVDGVAAPELSAAGLPDGVWFGSIARATRECPQPVRDAMAGDGDGVQPFAALNAAFFSDGFVLDIAPGVALDQPIEIVHLASGAGGASVHTRNVVHLGDGSRAGIFEVYAGEGRYWRNDLIEIHLGDRAELSRTVLVEEAVEALHLARLEAKLGHRASFIGFALLLGGRTVRHEASLCLAGEGAQCRLDGAYIVAGNDEANIVTAVDHAAPGGQTRELIKGVAAGRGHGAFQGRIVVREDAQQTDAHQLSRNLLIGERAVIDTKPELEIYADDVKCSHGASVGDLDEAALFYLRARGIPDAEARHMLIDGFLREAVESIEDFAIRTHLLRRLAARLATLEGSA
jgi:Fe-S cluster assembly protein SufD